MSLDLVLRGGQVFLDGELVAANLGIRGERIVSITASDQSIEAKRVVDVSGLWLLPGLIDMHSHHREPGFTHKEDITTATQACAAG